MTESSRIPQRASEPVHPQLLCPEWCTLAFERHRVTHSEPGDLAGTEIHVYAEHQGPRYGIFLTFADAFLGSTATYMPTVMIDDVRTETDDPEYLEKLSADAASAAAWLRAQQEQGSDVAAPDAGADCPDWCTKPQDHDPEDQADGSRVHRGPLFGSVEPGFVDRDGWYATVWGANGGHDVIEIEAGERQAVVDQMRTYARDLLAAAEWMDAQA